MKFKPFADDAERIRAIAKYFPIIEEISDPELKLKTAKVWIRALENCGWDDLEDARFNKDVPEQSLANHIRATTEGTCHVAKAMNAYQNLGLDLDRVIILGLLHDVSKVLEFEPDGKGGSRHTELGKYVQHGFMGAVYAMEEGFSLEYINLIVSHTPESNTKPFAREGMLFAFIDLADADLVALDKIGPTFFNRLH